jgi:hypothetical protein
MEQSQQSPTNEHRLADEASTVVGGVKEKVSGALTSARGAAGNMQTSLANALESGAAALRQRTAALGGGVAVGSEDAATPGLASGTAADVGSAIGRAEGQVIAAVAPRAAETGDVVASLMERGASWLREADLSELEGHITTQVKQYPVRTLAIAAGIGLLLARRRD